MNLPYELTSLWNDLAVGADVILTSSLKATVVLGIAGLVALAFKRASSAQRHWIWSLGLASVLLLLPLSLLMPSWPVGLFPQKPIPPAAPSAPLPEVAPAAPPPEAVSVQPSPAPTAKPAPAPLVLKSGASTLIWDGGRGAASAAAPPVDVALAAARSMGWAGWVMLLWAVGVAGVLAYFALGTLRAWWWTRQAEPVEDEAWTSLAKDIAWMLCLERPVRLVWSDRAAMPMAWGLLRPVVLLPRSASSWTAARRRVVLLHEMAHIQRWDPLTQALAQVACAVHWFNPVVWWGARRLRIERERACDDRVITSGTKASAYATHLIAIARSLRATPGAAFGTVSMARPSQLEGRLLAILEPGLSRRTLSRARSVSTGMLFAALLLPLAAMQPWADEVNARPKGEESAQAFAFSYATSATERVTPDEEVVQRTFSVSPGGTLNVRTDRGSIEVQTSEAEEVDVRVEIDARSEEDREKFALTFEQEGDDVSVHGKMENQGGRWNWNGDRLRVKYVVTVPSRFNVDLQTSGGSISVEDLEGQVEAETSGGSLSFGMIRGDINARTSGGSISLDGTSGTADVHTSGGSISLGKVAGTVQARTSGGSITVDEVAGTIDARTSGGSIRAAITEQPAGDSELRTSGGSITIRLADGIGVDVDAKTSAGRVTTDFDVPPRDKDEMDELEAPINGGGPMLKLRTSAGSIRIKNMSGEGTSLDNDDDEGERFGGAEEAMEERRKEMEARQEAMEERREAMEERREEMEEAMREAEEAHREAMREMEETMREMDVDINEAIEEAMAEVDMDEINEAIEEAMEGFEEAMAEMEEVIEDALENADIEGAIAESMRAVEEQLNSEEFAERVERAALEGVTGAFEEMAYEKDSVEVNADGEKTWRDPLDMLAELPAEYAVPALERVAENHEEAARREKAARLVAELAAEERASEEAP